MKGAGKREAPPKRSPSMPACVYARYGSRVKLWATFNETIVFIGHGYINGCHPPAVRDPARAIQACHHVFIAHAMAVKQFRESGIHGEIGFVNVLQPHTPLTDSAADRQASDMADAIHTHWLYDPVLKGHYPESLFTADPVPVGGPRSLLPAMTRCCATTAAILLV